jgi:hypothetical protein
MLAFGALILLSSLWLVVTTLMARQKLQQVRADVHTLRSQISIGDLAAARRTAERLASHARQAHNYTSGPLWALAAHLPAGGEPLKTIQGVTAGIDELGRDALPQLVSASQRLDPTKLRNANGTFDLAEIAAAGPALGMASASTGTVVNKLEGLPVRTWVPSVDKARKDLLGEVVSLRSTVRSVSLAVRIAPKMLGRDGPRTYLLSFETEAELRGSGGLPGAFAIARADRGRLTFTEFDSDEALTGVKSGIDLGPDYQHLYAGADAPNEYTDSNVSPHFPYAAEIWTSMWRRHSRQRLDGALALDPTAVSYLLAVTGPASMPDGTRVSASNVGQLTQQTVYALFGADQKGRKRYQLEIAKAVSRHLIGSKASATALIRAAGRAAGERRLVAWSADPVVEKDLAETTLGGAVQRTTRPYVGLSLNNAAGNKLDYYAHAALTWQRTRCGANGAVTATITVHNSAPSKLPAYVLGFTGQRGYPQRPGDNRLLIGYFATQGSQLVGIDIDGRPATAQIGAERGHPVFTVDLDLPRGRTRTIVLHLRDPSSAGRPLVLSQPMVDPLRVSVRDGGRCP